MFLVIWMKATSPYGRHNQRTSTTHRNSAMIWNCQLRVMQTSCSSHAPVWHVSHAMRSADDDRCWCQQLVVGAESFSHRPRADVSRDTIIIACWLRLQRLIGLRLAPRDWLRHLHRERNDRLLRIKWQSKVTSRKILRVNYMFARGWRHHQAYGMECLLAFEFWQT